MARSPRRLVQGIDLPIEEWPMMVTARPFHLLKPGRDSNDKSPTKAQAKSGLPSELALLLLRLTYLG